jgi:hypothetical protein
LIPWKSGPAAGTGRNAETVGIGPSAANSACSGSRTWRISCPIKAFPCFCAYTFMHFMGYQIKRWFCPLHGGVGGAVRHMALHGFR